MLVEMGREVSTVKGAWEVRVSACSPRSNRVRREVFPEPLGPMMRNVGSVMEDEVR